MAGNSRKGIVIQERDLNLFREISRMRVINREEVKVVAGFRSTTAVNIRLLRLVRAGLLRRMLVGTTVGSRVALYMLTPRSAALVGNDRASRAVSLSGSSGFDHQLQVNAIYLTAKFCPIPVAGVSFERWITFREPIPGTALIPDGYLELQSPSGIQPMFLEVDLGTEVSKIWQGKTAAYLKLATSGQFEKLFGQPRFRVLVVAPSDRRLHNIRAVVVKSTEKIFWLSTFQRIQGDALWSPVWFRPVGDQLQTLISET